MLSTYFALPQQMIACLVHWSQDAGAIWHLMHALWTIFRRAFFEQDYIQTGPIQTGLTLCIQHAEALQ